MPRGRAIATTIHVVALGLWLGSLVMTGAAAAVLFPTLRDLRPSLPEFAAYGGDHWRLAAGRVAERVFSISDGLQLACAATAGLTTLAFRERGRPRPAELLRTAGLLVAMGALAFGRFALRAPMNSDLNLYRDAARSGDTAGAELHRADFDASHPAASRAMVAGTAGVLMALVGAAWCTAAPRSKEEAR